jgi:hypothetical protein
MLKVAIRPIDSFLVKPRPGSWIAELKGRSRSILSVRPWGSSPTIYAAGIRQWRMQLSNGLDSRRLHRRSVRGSVPTASLVNRRSNRSEPLLSDPAAHSRSAGET